MVSQLEVLTEEPSMEEALRLILPKIVGEIAFEVYRFQCKDDLLKRLPDRFRGYTNWLPDGWADRGACRP